MSLFAYDVDVKSKKLEILGKPILVYEDGRIWNDELGKFLKQKPNAAGYCNVCVNSKMILVHHLVLLAFVGLPSEEQTEARHLDGNPSNNHRRNLKWGTHAENGEDARRHGRVKQIWQDPKRRAKYLMAQRQASQDPKYRERRAAIAKRLWADPKYKERLKEAHKKGWQDSQYRAKQRISQDTAWKDPKRIEKMSVGAKKRWEDPEYRAKQEAIRGTARFRANRKAIWEDPVRLEKRNEAVCQAWADPDLRAKQSAAIKKVWEERRRRQEEA